VIETCESKITLTAFDPNTELWICLVGLGDIGMTIHISEVPKLVPSLFPRSSMGIPYKAKCLQSSLPFIIQCRMCPFILDTVLVALPFHPVAEGGVLRETERNQAMAIFLVELNEFSIS
jgi:hypothetical protein